MSVVRQQVSVNPPWSKPTTLILLHVDFILLQEDFMLLYVEDTMISKNVESL